MANSVLLMRNDGLPMDADHVVAAIRGLPRTVHELEVFCWAYGDEFSRCEARFNAEASYVSVRGSSDAADDFFWSLSQTLHYDDLVLAESGGAFAIRMERLATFEDLREAMEAGAHDL